MARRPGNPRQVAPRAEGAEEVARPTAEDRKTDRKEAGATVARAVLARQAEERANA